MALISITRLRVRSWRFLPMFYLRAFQSARQAKTADGHLASALLPDQNNTFWTATSWSDEKAMKAFMVSGAHGAVMKSLLEWCDEAALVHWTQDDSTLPSWQQAHARLQADGRRSKVNHPSPAHAAFDIPPPRTGNKT
jgi:hypothetical protein